MGRKMDDIRSLGMPGPLSIMSMAQTSLCRCPFNVYWRRLRVLIVIWQSASMPPCIPDDIENSLRELIGIGRKLGETWVVVSDDSERLIGFGFH